MGLLKMKNNTIMRKVYDMPQVEVTLFSSEVIMDSINLVHHSGGSGSSSGGGGFTEDQII